MFEQKSVKPYLLGYLVLAVVTAAAPAMADEDPLVTALNECKGVSDDANRLRCFDAVAALAVPESTAEELIEEPPPTPAAAPTAVTPPPAGTVPVTDEVGKERVEGGIDKDTTPKFSATVVRCEENRQSGQIYFFLENGQVWKQTNYRRLRFGECRFDVTLSKDTFGYELYIPSKDRTVRVSRIR